LGKEIRQGRRVPMAPGPAEREGCVGTRERGRQHARTWRNGCWGEITPGAEATAWSFGTGKPRR
jgi:hypothetical protein